MNRKVMISAALATLVMISATPAYPQDQIEPADTNALGAASDCSAEVDDGDAPAESAELELDEASIKWIQRIDGYFNGIIHLQGNFVQIDSQNQTIKGRFYVHRPGRLRFEYAQPSMLRIVSDGQYLSIEDHDLKTIDKYPLASTPFRMLLTENVDIIRDACIIAFSNEDDRIALTLRDRSGESPGQIKLLFAVLKAGGAIELREWVITDVQGLDTRIQLANLVEGEEVSSNLFDTLTVEFPNYAN